MQKQFEIEQMEQELLNISEFKENINLTLDKILSPNLQFKTALLPNTVALTTRDSSMNLQLNQSPLCTEVACPTKDEFGK